MPLIRLQNKVPPVYVEDSRDFQLFCRLYDMVINGLKYDIDGISRLVNTKTCKSTTLQLLQTKLGFFTNKHLTDEALRYILDSFILLIRKKGTKEAIEQAVYMFLKINSLETAIKVDIINGTPSKAQKLKYGQHITDHCVVIGIESSVRDTTPLYEVLKYIVPFGYNIFFYFFVGFTEDMTIYEKQYAKVIYVSNDINSPLSGSIPPTQAFTSGNIHADKWGKELPDGTKLDWYNDVLLKKQINAVNSVEIIPQNEDIKTIYDTIPIVQPGYENTLNIKFEEDIIKTEE